MGVFVDGIESLRNPNTMASLCDEYANAGIDELYRIHKDSDDEQRDYAMMMIGILQDNLIIE